MNRIVPVAVVCLSLLGASKTSAQPKLVKDIYGVGVAGNCCTHGAGVCGMFKARSEFRVVAAFEQNPRRAKELADVLSKPLAASYDAVIRDPEVDVVAVTCDPCDKAAIVEQAARAGKHIFLNKPPCDSLDAARRIARAVKEHKVWLVHDIPMVRAVPVFARLLDEIRTQPYGKVMGYHHLFGMNFDPAFDLKRIWPERLDPAEKSGGGEMTNMGCYAVDFAVALFGRPRAVTAKWRKQWDVYRQAGVENFGQIALDYGEFLAFLEVGKQQLSGPSRHSNLMTLNFERRTLMIDASAQLVAVNHVPVGWKEFGRGAKAASSVDQLLSALREGRPPSSGAESVVAATEVLMAAYRSIVEARTIALPLESGTNPLVKR